MSKRRRSARRTSRQSRPAGRFGAVPQFESLEPRQLLSAPVVWHNVGVGGTGTCYYANVNPLNTGEMYIGADMGEVWHTTSVWSASQTWETLNNTDQLASVAMLGPAVQFTSDTNIQYGIPGGSGAGPSFQPKKSYDGGKTWAVVPGWNSTVQGTASNVIADPNSTDRLIVLSTKYTASGGNGYDVNRTYYHYYYIYYSNDGGNSFSLLADSGGKKIGTSDGTLNPDFSGKMDDYYKAWTTGVFWDTDPTHGANAVYYSTIDGVYYSTNLNLSSPTWTKSAMTASDGAKFGDSDSDGKPDDTASAIYGFAASRDWDTGARRMWITTWRMDAFDNKTPSAIAAGTLTNPHGSPGYAASFLSIYSADVTNPASITWNAKKSTGPTTPQGQIAWADTTSYGGAFPEYPRIVQMADNNISQVWVGGGDTESADNRPIVYRSDTNGATWARLFQSGDTDFNEQPNQNLQTHAYGENGDFHWGWQGVVVTMNVLRTNANIITWTTAGTLYGTQDGGANWVDLCAPANQLNPAGQQTPTRLYYSSSMNETSVWDLTFPNPIDIFAACTDVTAEHSNDGGVSWQLPVTDWVAHSVYANTYYDSIYDNRTGVLYACTSGAHDMYVSWCEDYRVETGGTFFVVMSTDFGANWTLIWSYGATCHPFKALALDPNDPNKLYIGVANHNTPATDPNPSPTAGGGGGIYLLDNLQAASFQGQAAHVTRLANQPTRDYNNDAVQEFAAMHPENLFVLDDGTLVCVCALRGNATGGGNITAGVWVSTDGGSTWQDRSSVYSWNGSSWTPVTDTNLQIKTYAVTIDPNDPAQNTWFLAMYDAGTAYDGYIYKTTDRGQHWTQWANVQQGTRVWIRPGGKEMILGAEAHGIFYCEDYTAANPVFYVDKTFPFSRVTNVSSNPWNPDIVWATTFGNGMWWANFKEAGLATPPTNITTRPMSNTEVKLTWTVNAPFAATYRIESSADGVSGWTTRGTCPGTLSPSFLVTGLTGNTKYFFRVVPVNASGDGKTSAVVWARTDSSAALIANEGFNATSGNLNGFDGTGDSGWSAAWVASTTASTLITDTVTPTNPPDQAGTGAAQITSSATSDAYRLLGSTVATAGSVLWASFEEYTAGGAGLVFGDNTNGFGFGTPQYGSYAGFYTVSGGTKTYHNAGSSGFGAGTNHLFVLKLQFESDQVYVRMFVDPTPGLSYPDNEIAFASPWGAGTFVNTMLPGGTNKITLSKPASGTAKYDEVRIGGTYADVTPKSGGSAPAAPTGLAVNNPKYADATVISDRAQNHLILSWTDNSTNEEAFHIYSSADVLMDTVLSTTRAATGGTYTYTITNLSANTSYSFKVASSDKTGDSSHVASASLSTTPLAPAAVTNLAVSAAGAVFTLTWSDTATETGYRLQYTDNSRNVSNNEEINWTTVNRAQNTTSYQMTLSANVKYYFRIIPSNTGGDATCSNLVNCIGFGAPTGVTASGIADTQMAVSWTDNAVGETGFTVQKSTDGSTWTSAGTAGANATTMMVTGLNVNTVYQFRVRADGTGSVGTWSSAVAGRTLATIPNLQAYEGFNYSPDASSTTEIDGQTGGFGWSGGWTVNGTVEDIYAGSDVADSSTVSEDLLTTGNHLYVVDSNSVTRSLATPVGASDGTYVWASALVKIDASPKGGVTLVASDASTRDVCFGYYWGSTYSMGVLGNSSWTYGGTAPTVGSTHFLVLRIHYVSGNDYLDMWADPDPTLSDPGMTVGVNGYLGQFRPSYNLASANAVKIIGSYSARNHWDELRVSTTDTDPTAGYAAVAALKLPGIPTGLGATGGLNKVDLAWTEVVSTPDEAGYSVERSTDQLNYSKIGTAAKDATAYSDGTATAGITYYYRISSYNATGDSMYSNVASGVASGVSVTISATDASAGEGTTPDTGTYRVTRTGSTTSALTVNYSISGTAANTSDYSTLGTTVVIPAGSASATITITPINDTLIEGSETAILTVTTGTGYAVGSPSAATVTIADNDFPSVTISATTPSASEQGPVNGVFRVTRAGSGPGLLTGALTVSYSIAGTATNGSDYSTLGTTVVIPNGTASATITVAVIDDTIGESTETAILTVATGTGYTVGSPSIGTVTIADNDGATVTVSATDASAAEDGASGPDAGVYTFTRSVTSGSLTVNYTMSGTAASGTDYTAPSGSVVFPSGSASATVTLTPIRDDEPESTETAVLTITSGAGYTIGSPSAGTVNIADNGIIAYEGFNYSTGSGSPGPLEGANGGYGFSNAWDVVQTGVYSSINSGSLSYDYDGHTLKSSGNNASLWWSGGTNDAIRTITDSGWGVTGTSRWIGFMMSQHVLTQGRLLFSCVVLDSQLYLAFPRTTYGDKAVINSTTYYGTGTGCPETADVTVFVVARIDFGNMSTTADKVYMWANNQGGTNQSLTPGTIPSDAVAKTLTLPLGVYFNRSSSVTVDIQASQGGIQATFDEIRYGATYYSVAPDPIIEGHGKKGKQAPTGLPAAMTRASSRNAAAFLAAGEAEQLLSGSGVPVAGALTGLATASPWRTGPMAKGTTAPAGRSAAKVFRMPAQAAQGDSPFDSLSASSLAGIKLLK